MTVRTSTPLAVKRAGRKLAVGIGSRTARWRSPPNCLLVGGQRCGTTSLFRALMAHPDIASATFHKGVNYFDMNYTQGPMWYRGHFPLDGPRRPKVTFDASGYYMFHPHAPGRIIADLPDVRIVAMVRDPVERAYSAHQHESARGFEDQDFLTALALEDVRVEPALALMRADEHAQSQAHRHHAYRRRGYYAEQLRPFIDGLGAERVHIMESERFFREPSKEYARLLEFLGVRAFTPEAFGQYNAYRRALMDEAVRRELTAHFESHDEALGAMLGQAPVWRA